MVAHYRGSKQLEEKVPEADAKSDPYVVLRSKVPELADLTKETFTKYTSLVAAAARGRVSARENPILHDIYAKPLAGKIGQAFNDYFFGDPDFDADGVTYCAIRHVVIDDEIEENLDPEIQQVVLIGAGMDSRSYRLQRLANCHVFELDGSADLAEHKKKVLREMDAKLIPKKHDVIITDFAKYTWPEELVEHGFDPKEPTLWIIEALLQYLDEASVDRLMVTVNELSVPKSKALVEMCGTGAINMSMVMEDGRVVWHMGNEEKNHERGVLRALPWDVDMLLYRSADGEYSGRRWDPLRFARNKMPKDKITIGLFWVAACVKPEASENKP